MMLKKRHWGLVGFVLIEALVLSLGFWQLHRLQWKQDLIAQQVYLQSSAAPAVPLAAAMLNTQDSSVDSSGGSQKVHVQKVHIEGLRWLPHLFSVHPKTRDGHVGAELFALLELHDHRVLWVNLGWASRGWTRLDWASQRRALGDSGISAEALKNLPPILDGVLREPHPPGWFVPANDPAKNRWLSFDARAMAKIAGVEHDPIGYVERLGPPLQLKDHPRDHQDHKVFSIAIRPLRNDHLGYAITWFALAIALIITVAAQRPRPWLMLLRKRR
jgi:surfeit locus 1 family protein